MTNKTTYIKAILIVFGLLLLSRIIAFSARNVDLVTIISTIVELLFFIWGLVLITKK